MGSYQITSSAGMDLGTYEGATKRAAIEAMWRDAGWEPGEQEIDALHTEAGNAGDEEQARLCERALDGDAAARAKCVRVIRDARAEELSVREIATMATIYRVSAGQYDSDVRRVAGTLRFDTETEALSALRNAFGDRRWEPMVLVAVAGDAGEDTLVYRDQDAADRDDTGEHALAWVHCEASDAVARGDDA